MIATILLRTGARVEVDFNHKDTCKCGKEFLWAKTSKGKWMPIEECEDGGWISHFVTCPYAKEFRGKPIYQK